MTNLERNRNKLKKRKAPVSGKKNTNITEAVPLFNKAECEKVIEGKNNTFIVMGRDRPSNLESGYGGAGFEGAGCVDIVAGRAAPFCEEVTNTTQPEPIFADNSPEFDAARITVSQLTDIDKNFKLSNRNSFPSDAQSAVLAKADQVRLVARNSIKLYTGTDSYDSNGDLKSKIEGIDLIAGNDDSKLQAMVKGDSLVEYLETLHDIIRTHNSEIIFLYTMLTSVLTSLNLHTHISTPTGLPTTPSIELAAVLPVVSAQIALHSVDRQNEAIKTVANKNTYLKPYGKKNIRSKYNRVN